MGQAASIVHQNWIAIGPAAAGKSLRWAPPRLAGFRQNGATPMAAPAIQSGTTCEHSGMSPTRGEAMASPLATSCRLSTAKPARFSAWVSSSVSNDCKREVNAAPRTKTFSEPMSRKAGSCKSRSAQRAVAGVLSAPDGRAVAWPG